MSIASLISAAPRTTPMPVQPAAQAPQPGSGDGHPASFSKLLTQARQPSPGTRPVAPPTPAAPQRSDADAVDANTVTDATAAVDEAANSDRALERKASLRSSARPPAARGGGAKSSAEPVVGDADAATRPDAARDDEDTPGMSALPPEWRPPAPTDSAAVASLAARQAGIDTTATATATGAAEAAEPAAEPSLTAVPGQRPDFRVDGRHRPAAAERNPFDRREVGGDRPAPAWLDAAAPAGSPDPAHPASGATAAAADGTVALAATAAGGATAPGGAGASEPAAPAQASVAAPVTSPEFRGALGVQISVLAQGGVEHAELQLNPAEMGPISVRIAIDGDSARVDFGADVARTRELIEAGWAELAAALQDAGFTLSGGGVSQQSAGRGQAGHGGSSRSGRDDGIGRIDDPQPAPTARRPVVSGGVDTFA